MKSLRLLALHAVCLKHARPRTAQRFSMRTSSLPVPPRPQAQALTTMRGLRPQEVSCWLRRRDESKVSEHALVDNTPLNTKSLSCFSRHRRDNTCTWACISRRRLFPDQQSPEAGVARRAHDVRLLATSALLHVRRPLRRRCASFARGRRRWRRCRDGRAAKWK